MTGTGSGSGRTGSGAGSSTCPACGTSTAATRTLEPGLGGLSLDELETLARNEWRRRLGRDAYRRPHRRRFVRSLLVYALAPESPVRRSVLEDALWDEVAALEVWGLSRRAAEVELYRLARALWEVLERTDLDEERRRELMVRMDDRLRAELGWPELEWDQVRRVEGPLF
jgi:hypothetical protein